MKNFLLPLVVFCSSISLAQNNNGWVIESYSTSFDETVQNIENLIRANGLKVFSIVKHSEEAQAAGLEQSPTTLIIFGNPKVGTHLMNCDARIGYLLPLKILIWEDKNNSIKAGFIKAEVLLRDYNLKGCEEFPAKIDFAASNILKGAK
jgi:uncharacterized protein (DUF302 family)